MCVTFLNIDNDADSNYKLILVNNRDEQLDRITSAANWERGILAGNFCLFTIDTRLQIFIFFKSTSNLIDTVPVVYN